MKRRKRSVHKSINALPDSDSQEITPVILQASINEASCADAAPTGASITSHLNEVWDLQMNSAASIVSPYKVSPQVCRGKDATVKEKAVHYLQVSRHAALTPSEQHSLPHSNNELTNEIDENHSPILEMIERIESTESELNVAGRKSVESDAVLCDNHASHVEAACRAAAAVVAGELVTLNDDSNIMASGRNLADRTFRQHPEMIKFPEVSSSCTSFHLYDTAS